MAMRRSIQSKSFTEASPCRHNPFDILSSSHVTNRRQLYFSKLYISPKLHHRIGQPHFHLSSALTPLHSAFTKEHNCEHQILSKGITRLQLDNLHRIVSSCFDIMSFSIYKTGRITTNINRKF
jgi:hypothetical protein